MKKTFLVLIVVFIAFGCRSQYEKIVTEKSEAVDQMYESAKQTLNSFDTENQYIDIDTIVAIDLLDIDFQANETTISVINYATIYHYMLLLQEYPNSILKVVGYDLNNENNETTTSLSKNRAKEIKTRLVKGFSIPEKRILISNKSDNTCSCAKVKLIQPHLAFHTQLELLKEKGDSLNIPVNFMLNQGGRPIENRHIEILGNFLKENQDRKFQINVHMDAQGNDEANLKLSERRAKNLMENLIAKGAKPEMLEYVGHGETQPVNHCVNGVACTDEEHRANRRVVLIRK